MNICAYRHPEIVHDKFDCPICELIKLHETEIQELQEKINDWEAKYDLVGDELYNLKHPDEQ